MFDSVTARLAGRGPLFFWGAAGCRARGRRYWPYAPSWPLGSVGRASAVRTNPEEAPTVTRPTARWRTKSRRETSFIRASRWSGGRARQAPQTRRLRAVGGL